MNCFKLNFMFVLWCLKKLFLQDSGAAFVSQVIHMPEFSLVEEGDIPLARPYLLNVYEKDTFRCILVSTKVDNPSCVYVLNATIKQHLSPILFKGSFGTARGVHTVPDGVFGFPAITIPDGNKKTNQRGRITVADVTDFLNPKHYNITIDPMADPAYEYHQPVWMNDKEFIVGRGFLADGGDDYDLLLFKSSTESKTEPWTGTVLDKLNVTHMVLLKNIWKSYDAIFAIGLLESLCIFWLDVDVDAPKDWGNTDRLEHRMFEEEFYTKDLILVDANKDGKLDLLVSQDSDYGEDDDAEDWVGSLRVYEIPRSEDFKNPSKYVSHDLIELDSNQLQPNVMRTFLPMSSYEGKPWILVSGGVYGTAYYFVPNSEDVENWDYQGHPIIEKAGLVGGVEAIDIDGDGLTELFVGLTAKDLIKVFSFKYNSSVGSSSSSSSSTKIDPGSRASSSSNTPGTDGILPTDYQHDTFHSTIVRASNCIIHEVFGIVRICKIIGFVCLFGVFYLHGY